MSTGTKAAMVIHMIDTSKPLGFITETAGATASHYTTRVGADIEALVCEDVVPGDGLWVWEGNHTCSADLAWSITGTWRRPTPDELQRIAEGQAVFTEVDAP